MCPIIPRTHRQVYSGIRGQAGRRRRGYRKDETGVRGQGCEMRSGHIADLVVEYVVMADGIPG